MVRGLFACLLLGLVAAGSARSAHDHGGAMAARPQIAATAAFDAQGRLWLARVSEGRLLVSRSLDSGESFGAPVAVNAEPEPVAADGENRPKLAFGRNGEIFVSWTRSLEEAKYAGHIRFSRSLDDGKSFSAPITINEDRAPISHRFDSMAVDGDGRLHLVWLDRRDSEAARAEHKAFTGISLYQAVSEDGGASFSADRKLVDHSCECCRIAMAVDPDGVPVIVWRQIYGANVRDHALLRLDGRSAPVRVSEDRWAIDACPHHGPSLAVDAQDRYHVAWFTNGEARQGLFYARSDDRGGRFSAPLGFGDPERQPAHPFLLARGDVVHLVWKEFDGRQGQVRLMSSRDGGDSWDAPRTVASVTGASDHPQLIADDRSVWLFWMSVQDGPRLIPLEARQ